jgi:hypothetical protein
MFKEKKFQLLIGTITFLVEMYIKCVQMRVKYKIRFEVLKEYSHVFRANYALGRPVKGTATIAVYPRYKEHIRFCSE